MHHTTTVVHSRCWMDDVMMGISFWLAQNPTFAHRPHCSPVFIRQQLIILPWYPEAHNAASYAFKREAPPRYVRRVARKMGRTLIRKSTRPAGPDLTKMCIEREGMPATFFYLLMSGSLRTIISPRGSIATRRIATELEQKRDARCLGHAVHV